MTKGLYRLGMLAAMGVGLMLLCSCQRNRILHEYADVDIWGWEADDTVSFVLPKITRTGGLNVSVGVRRTSSYQYERLRLLSTIYCDDEWMRSDTVMLDMYEENGRNESESMVYYTITQDIPALQVDSGHVYSYYINHLMQQYSIQGIKDVGLEVWQ